MAEPVKEATSDTKAGLQVRIYGMAAADLCTGYLGLSMVLWMFPLLNFFFPLKMKEGDSIMGSSLSDVGGS